MASDVDVVRQLDSHLEYGGTDDGAGEIRDAVGTVEDATVKEFTREDEKTDQLQDEHQEIGADLRERGESVERDIGVAADTRVETQETINELIKVKEKILQDFEFLDEEAKRAQEMLEMSEQAQQEQQARVHDRKDS
jgi:hypothetical protein